VQIQTIDAYPAAVGIKNAGEKLEGGGFAGAVGAKKADDFARRDVEGEIIDGFDPAVVAFVDLDKFDHRAAPFLVQGII